MSQTDKEKLDYIFGDFVKVFIDWVHEHTEELEELRLGGETVNAPDCGANVGSTPTLAIEEK